MSRVLKTNLIAFLLFACIGSLAAQDITSNYERKEYVKDDDTLKYRILYPENMKPEKQYPLVLFLHGAGRR